jgi:aconitase B
MKQTPEWMPMITTVPTQEESAAIDQRKWEDEQLWSYRQVHPEKIPESKVVIEDGELVESLTRMFEGYEAKYSLEQLFAITDITVENYLQNTFREEAKKALYPFSKPIFEVRERARNGDMVMKELVDRYDHATFAVGKIQHGVFVHEWEITY